MREQLESKATILAEKWGLSHDHIFAFRFAINVAIATTIVWATLKVIGDSNPIWAIASMVAASDPQPDEARRMFKARLSNVLVGCVVGMVFLLIGPSTGWLLPFALATTVLVSSLVIRIKTMWRQAPITAAVVIAAGILDGSKYAGVEHGLHKVAEVIFGCLVGLLVSLLMAKVWIIKLPQQPAPAKK